MRNINVELIANTPLYSSITGARTCWKSFDRDDYTDEVNIGRNNEKLLRTLVQQYHHESVIEHTVYTFRLSKFSRLILQELARHRTGSYSVESTRYVIRKDIKEYSNIFDRYPDVSYPEKIRVCEYFLTIPYVKSYVPEDIHLQFDILHKIYLKVIAGVKNDEIKYILPENWRVNNAIMTIDARNLRNLLSLRLSPSAHFEFRYLAYLILREIPESHRILFEDIINDAAKYLDVTTDEVFTLDNIDLLKLIIGKDRFKHVKELFQG